MPKQKTPKSLEIKIATVVAVTVILHSADLTALEQSLQQFTNDQRDYFDNELAVVELALEAADLATLDWPGLIALLKSWQLNPAAVRGAPTTLIPKLAALGLSQDEVAVRSAATAPASDPASDLAPAQTALFSDAVPEKSPEPEPAAKPTQSQTPAQTPPTAVAQERRCMIIDTPVRGGQRIYARDADLIVTAAVNAGAELIADGSIHVYAPLRGRALAGANGDAQARIYALSMEAELVSIAGIYRTFEDGQPKTLARKPIEVRLQADRLEMRAIATGAPAK